MALDKLIHDYLAKGGKVTVASKRRAPRKTYPALVMRVTRVAPTVGVTATKANRSAFR